jgi:hypothetical protein
MGLVLEPPEGVTVDDPVAVALEGRPEGVLGLGVASSPRKFALYGIGGEPLCLNIQYFEFIPHLPTRFR